MPRTGPDMPENFPLVAPLQTRSPDLPLTKDARLYNGYAEFNSLSKEYDIYKRMGLGATPFVSETAGVGQGTYTYTGNSTTPQTLTIINGTLYVTQVIGFPVPHFVTAAVGTVDSDAPYQFETISSSPQVVVLGNGIAAYIYQPSGGTLTQITDPNFPLLFAPGWAFDDGTLYVMSNTGGIYGSSIDDPSTWSALNLIQANSNADAGIALAKQLTYVIAMKQWTTQIFYDNGNAAPGSPLSPVPDSQMPLGCASAQSVQSIDNTLLWVTSNQTVSPQIVQMDNLIPQIVSTPGVERILNNFTFVNTTSNPFVNTGVESWSIKFGGHRFYGLTMKALNLTLVYDLDQKLWYIWTDPAGNYWPVVCMTYFPPFKLSQTFAKGIHYAQHATNGGLYPLDAPQIYPTDLGQIFPVDIYTPNFDGSIDRTKQLNMIRIQADRQMGSTLQARYSDDDYVSWSNFRTFNLGVKRPILPNWGSFYRRAMHFRHACPTPLRLRAVSLQIDVGSL